MTFELSCFCMIGVDLYIASDNFKKKILKHPALENFGHVRTKIVNRKFCFREFDLQTHLVQLFSWRTFPSVQTSAKDCK